MKKIFPVLLMLAMCLWLSACGGIPGQEAAQIYPDIIGDWGRDPFGEEFVLTLSEDGSCSLLGIAGTWTLDKEGSNDAQVLLTVKTEHVSYRVQMERLQEDDHGYAALLVTDLKEGIKVYEDKVFLPGTIYISTDLALQTIPEIVGEWGSLFFYEEPALTIREDGTCALLRQPGRWCITRYSSNWPSVSIDIYLDNGEQYICMLTNYAYPEPEYRYDMLIHRCDGVVVYPDNYKENVYDFYTTFATNRIRPLPGEEWIPIVIGNWAESGSRNSVVTFREDGTCRIFGKDGVWGIDWLNYESEKKNGISGAYWYVVKIDGNNYQVSVWDDGYGRYELSIHGDLQTHDGMIKLY